ncbi:rRNA 2'-O-methyltransferase fibrillarin [Venturia nashicola]|uniref:rRNA 2'-O-methyltransferase fibrillarin n=1 Tax=Venturia nashicola TaxID=86259 RepID=A0A4Z1P6J6_9PEZI|nr:rRNA 2'-O-methyltransferase fibrillarin [Venturia nashicola]TLD36063.1 rRNA 2'-O-methyltransferase fibrillarin [Venturia nashicola]
MTAPLLSPIGHSWIDAERHTRNRQADYAKISPPRSTSMNGPRHRYLSKPTAQAPIDTTDGRSMMRREILDLFSTNPYTFNLPCAHLKFEEARLFRLDKAAHMYHGKPVELSPYCINILLELLLSANDITREVLLQADRSQRRTQNQLVKQALDISAIIFLMRGGLPGLERVLFAKRRHTEPGGLTMDYSWRGGMDQSNRPIELPAGVLPHTAASRNTSALHTIIFLSLNPCATTRTPLFSNNTYAHQRFHDHYDFTLSLNPIRPFPCLHIHTRDPPHPVPTHLHSLLDHPLTFGFVFHEFAFLDLLCRLYSIRSSERANLQEHGCRYVQRSIQAPNMCEHVRTS